MEVKSQIGDKYNMNLFTSTLNQTAFLFGLIVIGYLLVKLNVLEACSAKALSKLENNVFIPALVMGTFIKNFTPENISGAWKILLVSILIEIVVIPFSIIISRLLTKDNYIQKIYTYGLAFANFGFMGNAVVSSLFPDIFFEYLIFTLPLWTFIYIWGVPRLLISDSGKNQSFKQSLKSFANPMFVGMLIGMIIGIFSIPLPDFIKSIVNVSGDCMSPLAMILTGIVVSSISLKNTFTNIRIYAISIIRLIVMPIIFIVVFSFIKLDHTIYICALCSLAMPLGLNTIVIPAGFGKNTDEAAGMAVISHLLSCITIPVIFMFIK